MAQQGSGLGSFPSLSAVLLQRERKPPSTAVLILLHSELNVLNLNNSSHFFPHVIVSQAELLYSSP